VAELSIVSFANYPDPAKAETFMQTHGGVLFAPQVRHLGNGDSEVLLILDEDGKLFGAFQVATIRLKGVKTLAQPYLHPHCALFTLPIPGAVHAANSRRKKVMRAVANYLSTRKERIFSLPFAPEWVDVQPLQWAGFTANVKYTYRLNLGEGIDLTANYSTDVRSEVRKAIALGAKISNVASQGEVYACLHENAAKQGFVIAERTIERLLRAQEAGHGRLFAVHYKNRLAAVALTLVDKHTMFYIMGAAQREDGVRGALSYALCEAIADAQRAGLATFDFEGSMIPGVENFFRGFGGDLKPYIHATKASFLLRLALRLAGRRDF
jgi:hypothetical protein